MHISICTELYCGDWAFRGCLTFSGYEQEAFTKKHSMNFHETLITEILGGIFLLGTRERNSISDGVSHWGTPLACLNRTAQNIKKNLLWNLEWGIYVRAGWTLAQGLDLGFSRILPWSEFIPPSSFSWKTWTPGDSEQLYLIKCLVMQLSGMPALQTWCPRFTGRTSYMEVKPEAEVQVGTMLFPREMVATLGAAGTRA